MSTESLLQALITLNQDLSQTTLTPADRRKYKGRWSAAMHQTGELAAGYRDTDPSLGHIPYTGSELLRVLRHVKDTERAFDLFQSFLKAAADTRIAVRSQAYAMIMGILYSIQGQLVEPFLDDRIRTRLTLALNSLRQSLDQKNRKISRALSAHPGKRDRRRYLGVALDWPKGGPALPHDRARGLTFSTIVCGHWPVSPGQLRRQALAAPARPALQAPRGSAVELVASQKARAPQRPGSGAAAGPVTLRELRQSRSLTQVVLARAAGLTQAVLSRTESRDDHLLSTLRRYVAGLGGALEVAVVFPNGQRVLLRTPE